MYYTVRHAGPRTRKQQIRHYLSIAAFVGKGLVYFGFSFFGIMAVMTANYGALAVLGLLTVLTGVCFNLFNLQVWLPGWRSGSWLVRAVLLTVYIFVALAVLLLINPKPL